MAITEDSLLQCISIPIRSDTYIESEECFTFEITSRTTVAGLSVEPSETEICITDRDCELYIFRKTKYYLSE